MPITILSPASGSVVCLQTDMQREFLEKEAERAALIPDITVRWYAPERSWSVDCSAPAGVTFRWRGGVPGGRYRLIVSRFPDLCEAWEWETDNAEAKEDGSAELTVFNLMIDTTYYACVRSENEASPTVCFRTADTVPRALRVPDVSNIRDAGGWRVPGGRIRQGLLYRGGEFESHMSLTSEGGEELRRLGIRTELDMRGEAVDLPHTAAEAYGVARILIPLPAYSEFLDEKWAPACRRFFAVLADESAYPVYYHCWGGADRTATAAFLLGALCGMSRADLITDYEYTSLSIWGVRSRNLSVFDAFLKRFDAFPGQTDREKAEQFFRGMIGMSEGEAARIREILVEAE